MPEKLNKLQIRAMVFDIIKSYGSSDDFDMKLHEENIKKLNSIPDKKFVCEILLKELGTKKDAEFNIIKYLIADFAELEMIESTIWEILYNPELSDKQKDIYLQLLRAMGGKIDIDELMNCLNDAESLVDEQTKGFIEVATVNPEAQIDFLDFLMSLRSQEQLYLLKSLFDDFKGDEMANLFSPCLRIDLDKHVKEEIISMMGQMPSYLSVKPLKDFISSSGDEDLKKDALKALNQIRAAGIDIDNQEVMEYRENEICKETKFYKAFLSQVDGCGNQGLIFSRITKQNKIIMFSTVINSTDGIMDCFGLFDITENEFHKVLSRFRSNDIVVPVTAEVAKYKLTEAEKLSSQKGSRLPYEYFCWNVYTCDTESNPIDYEALLTEKINITKKDLYTLYDTGAFDSWFYEYDDNFEVQQLIDFTLEAAQNSADPVNIIENKIDDILYKVFKEDVIHSFSVMLADSAFVFYMNDDFKNANIAANVSKAIAEGNISFLKDILRRSVLQYLANIVAEENEEKEKNIFLSGKKEDKLSPEKAYKILKELENGWDTDE